MTNPYRVIENHSHSEPALTITQITYAEAPYLKYEITNWGGSATPIEPPETDRFCDTLGSTIKYIKKYCDGGGNLE